MVKPRYSLSSLFLHGLCSQTTNRDYPEDFAQAWRKESGVIILVVLREASNIFQLS
jgi:hypothetical protein